MKPNPMEIKAAIDIFDRIVSAYERSLEIELEKEKVAAELELGCKRIALEEKRLNEQFKVVLRQINQNEKRLNADIRKMSFNMRMVERQQKAILCQSEKMMECILKTSDEARRERMWQNLLSYHGIMIEILNAGSKNLSPLLSNISEIGALSCAPGARQLTYHNETTNEEA